MNNLNSITVYCGSNYGSIPDYCQDAKVLGELIAKRGSRLIYGGGNIGMMGAIADSALAHGGKVIGVIPTFLREKEVAHLGLDELIETPDMPTRKAKLIELADGFIAMAGGLGTYEELFEVLSLVQLERTTKPIGLLNTHGFFDPLIAMMHQTAQSGFIPSANLDLFCVSDDPAQLLHKMAHHTPTKTQKWLTPDWISA
ncbi:MAG: TIGR00730 family Rossman fold protein [Moraxella sp.]|nr:TIGR00730 family Rossman fold protein [Moraxella sp.]